MGLKEAGLRGSLRSVSAGVSAIPDSDLYYPVDEGEGTQLSDNIGDNNASFQGTPTWESDSNFVGGFYLDIDASDDYVLLDDPSILSSNVDFAVGITVTVTGDSKLGGDNVAWNWSDNNEAFAVGVRNDRWAAEWYDGNATAEERSHDEPQAPYTARLLTTWDSEANSLELFLNADQSQFETDTTLFIQDDFAIGARPDNQANLGAGVDAFEIWIDELPDPQDDLDNQPWS